MRVMATEIDLPRVLVRLVLCLTFLPVSWQQTVTLRQISPSGCVCPGDILTYECTVMGREGSTVWVLLVFESRLELNHSQFPSVSAESNDTQIQAAARGISVDGSNYTSQFNVTVTSETMGTPILCVHAYRQNDEFEERMEIPTIGPLPPPNELCISRSPEREINYVWSPLVPHCPTIYYNINSSNCGSCPNTTNHTNVTCTNIPTNGSVDTCMLAIQTVVCRNITGNFSDPFKGSFCPTTTITTTITTTTTTAKPISTSLGILHPIGTTNISNPATITHTIDTCTKSTNNSGSTQTLVTHSSDTDTVCIVSISSLAVALIVTIVALVITTSVVLVKNGEKRKITYHLPQNKNEERNIHVEAENIEPLPTVSVAGMIENEETNIHVETVHKESIEPLPTVSVVGTIENEETNIHVKTVHKESIEPLPTVSVVGTIENEETNIHVHMEAVHKENIEPLPTISVVGTID